MKKLTKEHFKSRTTVFISLFVAAVLIGVDRLTKWLASEFIQPRHTIELISINNVQVLNFTYLENTGAAFNILKDKMLFLILTTGLFLIAALIILLSNKIKSKFVIWALSIIIAGGVGNLIDRVFMGYVVDFIDFHFINFAVFNVADICAVTGSIMFMIAVLREEVNNHKLKNDKTKDEFQALEKTEEEA